ncbi:hypothetical protein L209DRAFT_161631 [Thermothelomyces heterothallicus CBS 203.75]
MPIDKLAAIRKKGNSLVTSRWDAPQRYAEHMQMYCLYFMCTHNPYIRCLRCSSRYARSTSPQKNFLGRVRLRRLRADWSSETPKSSKTAETGQQMMLSSDRRAFIPSRRACYAISGNHGRWPPRLDHLSLTPRLAFLNFTHHSCVPSPHPFLPYTTLPECTVQHCRTQPWVPGNNLCTSHHGRPSHYDAAR